MLLSECLRCGFETALIDEWILHLWRDKHQNAARNSFVTWNDEDNLNSLVLYAPVAAPPPTPKEVLKLFAMLGIFIEDFVCWGNSPRIFIIRVSEREEVEQVYQILKQRPEALSIGGHCIKARRKSDVQEYEWPFLIGEGNAQAASKEPEFIELDNSSDDDHLPSNGSDPLSKNPDLDATEKLDCLDIGPEEEVKMEDDDEQQVMESETGPKLETKLSEKFLKIFHSKVKKENSLDDKKQTVKESMRCMERTWADIYLNFHNRLWPTCFQMTNSNLKREAKKEIGYQVSFDLTCFPSKYTDWLKDNINKDFDKLAEDKVNEFLKIMSNGTEISKRRKYLTKICSEKKTPFLSFTCHILLLYNKEHNTTAELTFSNIKCNKQLKRKMRVVQTIFVNLFKSYEKMEIKEWSSVPRETPSIGNTKEWTPIIVID